MTGSVSAGTVTGRARPIYKGTHPAWNDGNLREIAGQIRTPLLFAHVRASSGTPVQRSNCHPFRHGRWLWMHNGSLADFSEVRRDLLMAVDPTLFPQIEGSTDSETLFFLALTFGLTEDPPTAVARAVGLVEEVGRRHGVKYPVHMTVATSDGESIWLFRYSTEKSTSSLYYSTDVGQVRQLYPELQALKQLGDDSHFIVSEPLRDLPGAWNEVPDGSWGVVRRGEQEITALHPDFQQLRAPVGNPTRCDGFSSAGLLRPRAMPNLRPASFVPQRFCGHHCRGQLTAAAGGSPLRRPSRATTMTGTRPAYADALCVRSVSRQGLRATPAGRDGIRVPKRRSGFAASVSIDRVRRRRRIVVAVGFMLGMVVLVGGLVATACDRAGRCADQHGGIDDDGCVRVFWITRAPPFLSALIGNQCVAPWADADPCDDVAAGYAQLSVPDRELPQSFPVDPGWCRRDTGPGPGQ